LLPELQPPTIKIESAKANKTFERMEVSCLVREWRGSSEEAGPGATSQYYSISGSRIVQMRWLRAVGSCM